MVKPQMLIEYPQSLDLILGVETVMTDVSPD
jgi:hypothetical protein